MLPASAYNKNIGVPVIRTADCTRETKLNHASTFASDVNLPPGEFPETVKLVGGVHGYPGMLFHRLRSENDGGAVVYRSAGGSHHLTIFND